MKKNQKIVILVIAAIVTAIVSGFVWDALIDDDSWLTGKIWKQRTDYASWDLVFYTTGSFEVRNQDGVLESTGTWEIKGDIIETTPTDQDMIASYYAYKSFGAYDLLVLDSGLDHQNIAVYCSYE